MSKGKSKLQGAGGAAGSMQEDKTERLTRRRVATLNASYGGATTQVSELLREPKAIETKEKVENQKL